MRVAHGTPASGKTAGWRGPARFQQSSSGRNEAAAPSTAGGSKISTGDGGGSPISMAAPEAITYISPAHEAMKPLAERPAKDEKQERS